MTEDIKLISFFLYILHIIRYFICDNLKYQNAILCDKSLRKKIWVKCTSLNPDKPSLKTNGPLTEGTGYPGVKMNVRTHTRIWTLSIAKIMAVGQKRVLDRA